MVAKSLDSSQRKAVVSLSTLPPYIGSGIKDGKVMYHSMQRITILTISGKDSSFGVNYLVGRRIGSIKLGGMKTRCWTPGGMFERPYYPGAIQMYQNLKKNAIFISLRSGVFRGSYYVMGMGSGIKALQTGCLGWSNMAQMLFKDYTTGKTYLDSYNLKGTRPGESELDYRNFRYSRVEVTPGAVSFRSRSYADSGAIYTVVRRKEGEGEGRLWEIYRTELNQMYLKIDTSKLNLGKTYDVNLGVSNFYKGGDFEEVGIKIQILEKLKKIGLELPPTLVKNYRAYLNGGTDKLIRCGQDFDLDKFLGIRGMVVGLDFGSKTPSGPKEGVDYIFKGRKYTIGSLNSTFLNDCEEVEDEITEDELAPFVDIDERDPSQNQLVQSSFTTNSRLMSKNEALKQGFGGLGNTNQTRAGTLLVSDLKIEGKWMMFSYQTPGSGPKTISMVYNPVNFTSGNYSKFAKKLKNGPIMTQLFSIAFIKASQDLWNLDGFEEPEVLFAVVDNGTAFKKPLVGRNGATVTTRNHQILEIYKLGRSNNISYLKRVYFKAFSDSEFVASEQKTWLMNLSPGRHFVGLGHATKNLYRFVYLEDPPRIQNKQNGGLEEPRQEDEEEIFSEVHRDEFAYKSTVQDHENDLKGVKPKRKRTERLKVSSHYDFVPKGKFEDFQFITAAYIDQKSQKLRYKELLIYANYSEGVIGVAWINPKPDDIMLKNNTETPKPLILQSQTFPISKELIGRTNHFDCKQPKIFNLSSKDYKTDFDFKPHLFYISCYFSVVGSFDYIIDYDLLLEDSMTLNFTRVLISSKLMANVVTPDGFVMKEVNRLSDAIVVKMKNIHTGISVNPEIPSQCPEIVVVYKYLEGNYPWAIYSCKDFSINDSSAMPLFASYKYDQDYIWITKTKIEEQKPQNANNQSNETQESSSSLKNQKYEQLTLSPPKEQKWLKTATEGTPEVIVDSMRLITIHQMKNSTLKLLKSLQFSDTKLTLRSLNSDKILAKLGLLNSITQTNFKIDFKGWSLLFFFIIAVTMLGVIYAFYRDLKRSESFSFLFKGKRDTKHLKHDWSFKTLYSEGYLDENVKGRVQGMILQDADDEDLGLNHVNEKNQKDGNGGDSGDSGEGDDHEDDGSSSGEWENESEDGGSDSSLEGGSVGENGVLPSYNFGDLITVEVRDHGKG